MNKKNDQFSDIALNKIDSDGKDIYCPEPIKKEIKILPMDNQSVFKPIEEISTREELYFLVDELKEKYKPFLENLSPELKNIREIQEITEFDYRLEEGRKWKKISIPHYTGPLGEQISYYKTIFQIEDVSKEKAYFACFKGVDYIAEVFINDNFVGSHTGFFAPFEMDFSDYVKEGENTLLVKVKNDYIWMGNIDEHSGGVRFEGEKIYAATGPGYDDPAFGWHHCPPGFGICQGVQIETRSRVFINDIFVRPMVDENKAEIWLELTNADRDPRDVSISLSLYGQNFEHTVFENYEYKPCTGREYGLGDSFTEQKLIAQGLIDKPVNLFVEKGVNTFKIPVDMQDFRMWESESPFLYQLQVSVSIPEKLLDTGKSQFGMRSFTLDTDCYPKGMFYLNGRKIRLRGANTMGHEQQCVMKGDFDQLLTDLLLAKACNMNFLRLTQRPVQKEIYDLCDQIGLMTQTDMPLFGVIRRGSLCELLRQTEEMERLVRNNPSNILITYINEPFPNASNKPHRHLKRDEMEEYFKMADSIVKMCNPDRVIKHVDGDYDPPSECLPDNHCYNMWYNGHGLDMGKLVKGHWQYVKTGWNYACGEFGVEGLEDASVMRKYYPESWMVEENGVWHPGKIVGAQSRNFHFLFYKTQEKMEDWVEKSQIYQAEGIRIMTEAFRRDPRMVSFALHLFIDAFPSGWMKTIMDVDRNPKKGFFAYREALSPLLVSLRSDRTRYYSGDTVNVEALICNDTNRDDGSLKLQYFIKKSEEILTSGSISAVLTDCSVDYQGSIRILAPSVDVRDKIEIHLGLKEDDKIISSTSLSIDIFPKREASNTYKIWGYDRYKTNKIARIYNFNIDNYLQNPDLILIEDFSDFKDKEEDILKAVRQGSILIFLELEPGEYKLAESFVKVQESSMMPIHFVSIDDKSNLKEHFYENDFRFWYEPEEDLIKPIIYSTFTTEDFYPLLASGNTNENGEWDSALALGGNEYGEGKIFISQLDLSTRLETNPVAEKLFRLLMES